jgi:hypothetical protein
MSGILNLRDASGSLLFPNVVLEPNKLTISGDLEPDVLKELIRFVHTAESASLFWFGDLLAWIKRTKSEDHAVELAAQSSNPDRVFDAMILCENLPVRFPSLSFNHHREAYLDSGRDAAVATLWLTKAEQARWSVSDLRRAIRSDSRTHSNEQSGPSKATVTITGDISRLKSKIQTIIQNRPLYKWSIDEVMALKVDLQPIADLIADLNSLEF